MKIEKNTDGITFSVKVQPKASRNEVVGSHRDCLKVKVTAPSLKGKANKECIKVLAAWLRIKASQVQIEKGRKSSVKRIKVRGDTENLITRLGEKLG